MLATAYINVKADNGRSLLARALIDQGSQLSFITKELCHLLKLNCKPAKEAFTGVGRKEVVTCKSFVTFTITPHFISTFSYKVTAYVLPQLTTYKPSVSKRNQPEQLENLVLADTRYNQAGKVDFLLSALVNARFIEEGLCRGADGTPIAMKTLLGWIVSGPVQVVPRGSSSRAIAHCVQRTEPDLNTLFRRF